MIFREKGLTVIDSHESDKRSNDIQSVDLDLKIAESSSAILVFISGTARAVEEMIKVIS